MMKTLNYVKPVCEVVEVEREGYILCASFLQPNNDSQIEDMTVGTGWDDVNADELNRTF